MIDIYFFTTLQNDTVISHEYEALLNKERVPKTRTKQHRNTQASKYVQRRTRVSVGETVILSTAVDISSTTFSTELNLFPVSLTCAHQ
jgi:hypothetical protein